MIKIPPTEFSRRRERLMAMMEPGSIAVLPGSRLKTRNRDVEYPFRQDSDFYYLTGFTEPDALLVLQPGRHQGEVVLFCTERDPDYERWNGARMGPERAQDLLGVDDAFPIADLADILPGMLEGKDRIYTTLGERPNFDRQMLSWIKGIRDREAGGAIPPGEIVALKHHLHELRLFKSAAELKVMRESARITTLAHRRAMRSCRPGMTEGQLEAELQYEFMRNNARAPAYSSIVGGGNNGCVMHYVRNDSTLKPGKLVLIDAGSEYQYYAADVTRTFPVSGRFNKTQQAVYEIVLAANHAGIEACRAGSNFNAPHEAALAIMVQGLIDLKLLQGSVADIVAEERYRPFCPHKASHWLGLDVHDVGDYRLDDTWRALEPGMVMTVEPGIYIPDNDSMSAVAARYRGMGIRVEDDVHITASGPENLSEEAPKSVADIQREMRRSPNAAYPQARQSAATGAKTNKRTARNANAKPKSKAKAKAKANANAKAKTKRKVTTRAAAQRKASGKVATKAKTKAKAKGKAKSKTKVSARAKGRGRSKAARATPKRAAAAKAKRR
ncbi:MAG: aminopeptidase P N-terminal domain-containing protein [Pseudomonadales bacterium]